MISRLWVGGVYGALTLKGHLTLPESERTWRTECGIDQCLGWMTEAIHYSGFALAIGGKAFGVFHPTERYSRAQRKEEPPGNSEPESPSGGRVEVLRRGTSRMDAARGVKGQDGPCMPAPGAAPEGGKSGGAAARPGCRGALLFGYFLLGTQEKVTRRKGEK